jgi:hypothetical protein
MIADNLVWIIIGVISIAIILVIVLLFSRKNKMQIEMPKIQSTKTQEIYKEHPEYPSELEQAYASAQTENYKVPVKPTKIDGEDYYYPPEEY